MEGTKSFPEIVGTVIEADVEYCLVDYDRMRKIFYRAAGDTVITSINYEGLPLVAIEFNIAYRLPAEVPIFLPTWLASARNVVHGMVSWSGGSELDRADGFVH